VKAPKQEIQGTWR